MDSTTPVKKPDGMSKLLVTILVIALAVLAFVEYNKRVQVAAELEKLTMQMEQLKTGNNPQNVAQAKEIVGKVKKHMIIPGDVDPTVATIVDVETLKQRNDFYKQAKNGDHLIVTPTRAILYDPDKDLIIDVVPVQLEPQTAAAASQPAQ
jgi:hypothetical protein